METSQLSTIPSLTLRPSRSPRSIERRTLRGLIPKALAATSVEVQPDSPADCPSYSAELVRCMSVGSVRGSWLLSPIKGHHTLGPGLRAQEKAASCLCSNL